MNVQIQTVNFDADIKLKEHVQKKIDKLKTFHDKITSVEIYLKLDNLGQKVKDKIAEIKVHVPKHDFFVKHSSKSFEESFDIALDSVITQIKRKKEKLYGSKAIAAPTTETRYNTPIPISVALRP